MSLLNTIKDQVSRGISKSYADWKDYISDDPFGASDYAVNQVARRYAKAVAEDVLKRAVTRYKASNRILHEQDSEVTVQCILETPINTDL